MVVPAENPSGAPIFKDLVGDPPTSESEFKGLWKFYFLSLIAQHLREYGISNNRTEQLIRTLEDAGLLPKETTLRRLLGSVVNYVRNLTRAESVEGGLQIDPATGNPAGLTGKITLREPNLDQQNRGLVSVDKLLEDADGALRDADLHLWLLLDRLDVAFAETAELERNALRALFRVYLDLLGYKHIALKIFLRSDIWQRISGEGFREASHITRHVNIVWNKASLLNLVIRRALHNDALRQMYDVDSDTTLNNADEQSKLFYLMFPAQVDVGSRNPGTFEWMLSRTKDATNETAPRELIHFLSSAREAQLRNLELGSKEPSGKPLFDRVSLREALSPVSQVRFEQTLCAEFPNLQQWLNKLKGEKTQQKPSTLAIIWDIEEERAISIADSLVEVGFFERKGTKDNPDYRVPFLYRAALEMVQGSS